MSVEIANPAQAKRWIARSTDASVLHVGVTHSNQVTTTGLDVLDGFEDGNEFLAEAANWSARFPALPAQGEPVEEGQHYQHGSGVVIARQSHTRTEHDPADVPALFLVARAPGTGIEWIAGENIGLGTVREFDGTKYKAVQAHVTQADWQPPNVPALWEPISESSDGEWSAGLSVTVNEVYSYQGADYRVVQSHTTQAGWEPPNVPALWEPV